MASIPPWVSLMKYARGYQDSQILFTVVKYKFAEFLKDGPKSGEQLAALAHTHEDHTSRLLRAAAALGIFSRDPQSLLYSLNDLSKVLASEEPASPRWLIEHMCTPSSTQSWSNLDKTVQSGIYAHELAFGKHFFESLSENLDLSVVFNKAMTFHTALHPFKGMFAKHYDFSRAKHVVDVGGGHGNLLTEILLAHPHLIGTNYDLPGVIEEAKTHKPVDFGAVESRFTYASGSFFESVPSGGDLYVLKFITHDWEAEKAIQILKNVRKVIPEHGKLVLIERVVKEVDDYAGPALDLHMMVLFNSRERTEAEYHQLFNAAGFKINSFLPLPSMPATFVFAIEGEKI